MTYLFKINPLQLCLIYSLRFHVLIHFPLNQFKILVHHLLLVTLPVCPIPLCSLNYSLISTQFYLYSILFVLHWLSSSWFFLSMLSHTLSFEVIFPTRNSFLLITALKVVSFILIHPFSTVFSHFFHFKTCHFPF